MIYCIICVGMLFNVAFARVVLPAMFRRFIFHPVSFECILSKINRKSLGDEHLCMMGKPKYFPISCVHFMFKWLVVIFLASVEQLPEKRFFYFSLFIFLPEFEQKEFRMLLMVVLFCLSALANKIMSSANSRWDRGGPDRFIVIGAQSFLSTVLIILWENLSMQCKETLDPLV